MINKYYNLNFYKSHKEIKINSMPEDNFNRNKLFYDFLSYYEFDNIIIKYKNKIFNNEKELKLFFKSHKKYH